MIGGFFASKETFKYNLGYCKIFDTKYNNVPCSKLTLKNGSPTAYQILLENKHPNLFEVFKLSQHSVYTKRVVPFSPFIDKGKAEYNRYVVSKVANVLEYLHTTLKKEHTSVNIESIFLEESGKVLLGHLEKSKAFESTTKDFAMLDSLCRNLTNKKLEELDTETATVFDFIYDSKFVSLPSEQPESLASGFQKILSDRSQLPEITKNYIFKIFVGGLSSSIPKENKIVIMDSLYKLDKEYFIKNIKMFFSVVDSNVRTYLLNKFDNALTGLDEISEDLSLGLRVTDKALKKLTIDFIFGNSAKFNTKSLELLFSSMISTSDSEGISVICTHLLEFDRGDVNKPIYKMLEAYLGQDKNILLVYKCIDKYFTSFSKVKITKIILPSLCEKLVEKNNQDYLFGLVERIINFLKANKNSLDSQDWSLRGIKGMLGKKLSSQEDLECKVGLSSKEDLNDWDDKDI